MEFDIEKFITNVKNIDKVDEPFQCNSAGEKYLYDLMLKHASVGGCMEVEDLDCGQFTSEELDSFCDMYDTWMLRRERANRASDFFNGITPKSNSKALIFF